MKNFGTKIIQDNSGLNLRALSDIKNRAPFLLCEFKAWIASDIWGVLIPHSEPWLQGANAPGSAWTDTEPASIPAATVWTCPDMPHGCTLPQEALLWLFKGGISKTELLVKRKYAHYFFHLCSFSKNPVLFVLDSPEHTAYKCSMSLQAKGTRETSLWNHQKMKKYVGNILLPTVVPCAANPAQSGQGVPGVV